MLLVGAWGLINGSIRSLFVAFWSLASPMELGKRRIKTHRKNHQDKNTCFELIVFLGVDLLCTDMFACSFLLKTAKRRFLNKPLPGAIGARAVS